MRGYFIIYCLLLYWAQVQSQDVQLSQFYNSMQYNNVAAVGLYPGDMRMSLSYRDQWSSIIDGGGFKSFLASYEQQISLDTDALSFKVGLLQDQVGGGTFVQNVFTGGVSYKLQISGSKFGRGSSSQFLSAGLSAGIGQFRLSPIEVWFGNQYDIVNTRIDLAQDPIESGVTDVQLSSPFYPDVGLGLMWMSLSDYSHSIYAGVALHHINRPNVSLLEDGTSLLSSKIVINLGGEVKIDKQLSLLPSNMFVKQQNAFQNVLGLQLRYSDNREEYSAIKIGLFTRWTNTYDHTKMESLVFTSNLDLGNVGLGFSYDITISNLNILNRNRGAFELSVVYVRRSRQKTISRSTPVF